MIEQVVRAGRCVRCGTCMGVPAEQGAAFCPQLPGREIPCTGPREEAIGPFRGLYLTRAADPAIRAGSQNGGTMTALLELALAEGMIDAAILTHSEGGLHPRPMLASSAADIRACRGSSYIITPSLSLLHTAPPACRRLGVTATPCKALAIRRMQAAGQNRVSLIFGLFCGWGLDGPGLTALVERHMDRTRLTHMDFPPGKYHAIDLTEDDTPVRVSIGEVYPLVQPPCRLCTDFTAEWADLSVGAARSPDGWDVDRGWNQLIIRTEKGQALLTRAKAADALEFKEGADLEKLKKAALSKKRAALADGG